jgi:hypothetical protein
VTWIFFWLRTGRRRGNPWHWLRIFDINTGSTECLGPSSTETKSTCSIVRYRDLPNKRNSACEISTGKSHCRPNSRCLSWSYSLSWQYYPSFRENRCFDYVHRISDIVWESLLGADERHPQAYDGQLQVLAGDSPRLIAFRAIERVRDLRWILEKNTWPNQLTV